jgi:hypothetical protein
MKHWLQARAKEGDIEVYATKGTFPVNRKASDGMYCNECRVIVVNCDSGDTDAKETLFHELLHAAFSQKAGKAKRLLTHANEEIIIRCIEGPLYRLLTRNGWLRLPRPPRMP